MVCVIGLLLAVSSSMSATAGTDESSSGSVPVGPIPGSRQVQTRDGQGRLDVFTAIPSASQFNQEGGSGAPCGAWVPDPDPTKLVGASMYVPSMNWIFIEGDVYAHVSVPIFDGNDRTPASMPVVTGQSLATAARVFSVFCEDTQARNYRGTITVTGTDPALDPRPRAVQLWNSVRLERPVVVPDPTVVSFGRLITRHPSWLSISPGSWGMRTSAVEYWRGWELQLILRPVSLSFVAEERPPAGTTPGVTPGVRAPFAIDVPCVAGGAATAWGQDRFPARPVSLPDVSAPGIGTEIGLGGCVWTPAFLGTVSLTARVTYEVTFWMSGFTERLADYVWESVPVEFPVGGLSVVNVNGAA